MMLVFGSRGQLGTELMHRAQSAKIPYAGFSHQSVDIADKAAVATAIREHRASLVVNAAAYNAVDKAETEPEAAMHVNAEGPSILAEACRNAGIPLIHISTDFVFDGASPLPYREDDPIGPLNAYGRGKAAGEEAIRLACPRHLILRTAWLFGIHGSNFLKTILSLAAERDEIRVVADQFGSPTCTADLAQAILVAAAALSRGDDRYGTYHVAGSGRASRYDFAEAIVAAQRSFTGRNPRLVAITSADYPTAARRPSDAALDSAKFQSTFGFRPAHWRLAASRTVHDLFGVTA
jgi:dTDP-4-dehydrorhamnose reductase